MEEYPALLDDHDGQIAKCLVDLHGTCIVMPFHRQGLPYLSLAVIGMMEVVYLLRRMGAREMNAPHSPYAITEWHLLVGRFGLLFYTIETVLDYIRLFIGSFDQSWPYYIRDDVHNASAANHEWARRGYRDAEVQTFLWWYCCFLQALLLPLTLYSVSQIYYKARRRTDDPLDAHSWFFKSSSAVLLVSVPSLVGFFLGPLQGPLEIISITGLWSLASSVHKFWFLQELGVFVWQASLVWLGIELLKVEGDEKKFGNSVFLAVNVVALIGAFFVPLFVHDHTGSSWSPAMTRLLQQVVIASQLWADSTHNRDDYGRLADDDYLPAHRNQSLRQPLLAGEEAQEHQEEEEHVIMPGLEEPNDEQGELEEEDSPSEPEAEEADEQEEDDELTV